MNQKAMAASTPDTITPWYSAIMILLPSRALTAKVPMIEAMMEAPPSASG